MQRWWIIIPFYRKRDFIQAVGECKDRVNDPEFNRFLMSLKELQARRNQELVKL